MRYILLTLLVAFPLLGQAEDWKGLVIGTVQRPLKTDKQGRIKVTIQPNGGAVLY